MGTSERTAGAAPGERTVIDAAVDHLRGATVDPVADARGAYFVAVPSATSVRVEDLERLLPAPRRLQQAVTLETPGAFVSYVRDFAGAAEPRIFASLGKREVRAVLDWHGTDGAPSWCGHRAVYPAAFDDRFQGWFDVHGKPMTQRRFAEFLEDRAEDALTPDPATLMEVAQRFETIRNVDFKSAVNLATGERQFRFEESDRASGTVQCPRLIKLRTPVYYGAEPVEWVARLAYAIDEGKLTFTATVHRLAELLDREFERLVDRIAVDLPGLPFHRGLPG